jgi:glycosyltransferase involved in cell wall biosynthesis
VKVALVVPGGFDPTGEEHVIPALQALAAELGRRHDVQVLAGDGRTAGPHRHGGATVHHFGREPSAAGARAALGRGRRLLASGRLVSSFAAALARARAGGRIDIVHALWAGETGILAALAARALRVPAVLSIGGGERVWLPDIRYGGAGTRRGRARTRLALGLARAVTAGSAFALGFLPPPLAARAELVPLGIDVGRFAAAAAEAPAGPPWRLVHVASLNRVKDQGTLLLAFRELLRRVGGAATLECAGVDTLAGKTQRHAAELGIGDRVRFMGYVRPSVLPALFRGAHLHVLSSRYESQGVAILEAAAAGVPTVGTAVGLLATLAPHAARAVPPQDPGALAGALASLLADDDGRRALGSAARRYANEHDAAWTAAAFERIYRRLARC